MLQILTLKPQNTPYQGLLNKNNALNQASVLNIKATPTSLTITLPLYPNIIYKRLILIAIYHTNLLVTIPNLYLVPALYLVSTTYKSKATTNVLQEPLPAYYQKVYFRVKLLSRTVLLQDLFKHIRYYKPQLLGLQYNY